MRKIYIDPNGKQVPRPKSLVIDNTTYVPPTDEQLVAVGYEIREIIDPAPEPYIPTYSELVEQYIRENGYPTYGAELAVINNYTQDPIAYAEAYATYMQTRVDAKQYAQTHPYRELE